MFQVDITVQSYEKRINEEYKSGRNEFLCKKREWQSYYNFILPLLLDYYFIAVDTAMSVSNICVSISLLRLRVLFTVISLLFSFPIYKGRHVCRAGFSRLRRCAAR